MAVRLTIKQQEALEYITEHQPCSGLDVANTIFVGYRSTENKRWAWVKPVLAALVRKGVVQKETSVSGAVRYRVSEELA